MARSPSAVGVSLIATASILGSFALVTTALRVIVRKTRGAFGWDDVLMVAAVLTSIIRYSIVIHSVSVGYGDYQQNLSEREYIRAIFFSWFDRVIFFLALCLLKTSVGLLIMRIMDNRRSKLILGLLVIGLALSNFEVLIVLIAGCRPLKAWWTPGIGQCWPTKYRIFSICVQVGCGIIIDLVYIALPITAVWKLNMAFKKKVWICSLLCTGLIASFCAILRAWWINSEADDLTRAYGIGAIFGNIELGLGIVSANAVLVRSFIEHFRDKMVVSSCDPSLLGLSQQRATPSDILKGPRIVEMHSER